MKNNNLIVTLIAVVVVGAVAFFGGMQFQKSQAPGFGNRQAMMTGGPNGQMGQGRSNFQGMRPVSGEIISQDDNSITVKMEDGSSKIIILSDDTSINKTSEGAKADLKTGEKVTAFGTENSDGSVTAQNVSIGDNMMLRMGSGGNQQPSQGN